MSRPRLLAVQPHPASRVMVPAVGPTRMARALVTFGYPAHVQAQQVGLSLREINYLLTGHREHVDATVRDRIAQAFDRLSGTPGPSQAARRHGLHRGWAPPAAWDDDTINNPDAQPDFGDPAADVVDEVLVRRVLDGHAPFTALSASEQLVLWRLWKQQDHMVCGRPAGPVVFAREFRTSVHRATRLRNAAVISTFTGGHQSRTSSAANSHTNRKAA